MMALADQLLIVSDLFGAATARSRARVSTILFNDGKRLDRIARGFDIGTRSFEAAMSKLSADWPVGADWPTDIYRPAAPRGGAPAPAGPEPTPSGGAGTFFQPTVPPEDGVPAAEASCHASPASAAPDLREVTA